MAAPRPLLVYDGDCSFCRSAVGRLRRRGLLEKADARPFGSFEGEQAAELVRAGIANALIVLDEGGRPHAGIDGIALLYEAAGRTAKAAWLRFPPVRGILALGYRFVAQQRRLLSGFVRG